MGKEKAARDLEKAGADQSRPVSLLSDSPNQTPPGELHRLLKNRHVAMISMGGAIGTGLFIATGTALQHGGPVSLILGYTFTGIMAWSLMSSLGEMISHLPIVGGHLTLADRFFSPSLAFTLGWSYWYLWSIVLPAELSASAILMSFWTTKVNAAVWIAIFLFGVAMINVGGAEIYGEMEFWFASIKILTIVGVIILGIVVDLGGTNGDRLGFRYWKDPGLFVQYHNVPGAAGRFLGFFSVLINAAFAYVGVEMPAIAAAEAKNPRRNLPKAIKRVAARVLIFYVAGTVVISLLVSSSDPQLSLAAATGAKSPFVIAMKNAGIKGLPSVINASLLSGAWSAASSDLYVASRSLYGLSITGNAPRFLAKTTSKGLPIYCYLIGISTGTLAFMSASDGQSGKVFGYLANMTSVAGLLTWAGIFATYIRFHAGTIAQSYDRSQLPYQSPGGPAGAWCGLILCSVIILFNGFDVFMHDAWDLSTFITCYLPVLAFFALYFAHRWWTQASLVEKSDMDFVTGSRDAIEEEENPPRNWLERVWRFLI